MAGELDNDGLSMDASSEFLQYRQDADESVRINELEQWHRQRTAGALTVPRETGAGASTEDPFRTNQQPPAEQSAVGRVARNVAEVPRQVFGGIEDAVRHATSVFNPLTDWLNENVADLRIDPVPNPKTATGRITRSVSEFLTGFVPALKGLRGLGMTGKVAAPLMASAIADFTVRDPHEKRLSNLWQDAGLPANVLTDFLAADPNDSAIEGRFKSSLEGVLTGAALEGVMHAARAVRASKATGLARTAQETRNALREQFGEVTEEAATRAFGRPSAPLVEVASKKALGQSAAQTAGTQAQDLIAGRAVVDAGNERVFINFARIDSPDDVKAVIGEMANRFRGSIKEAQRGVISQKETARMADDLGMSVTDLLSRRQGAPLNAEEAVAARRLWAASGERLVELAKRASDPNAGSVDQFAFRRALATHHAVQAEVIGARTETARALAAWRIPAGGGIEQAKAIKELVDASGGQAITQDFARRLSILAEHGDPRAVAKFAEKAWGATTMDAVREVWINGLLSSPATHVVNMTSNMAVGFQQIMERGVAARVGQLRGTVDGVEVGEAAAMAYGMTQAVKDAFRAASKALRTGETGTALGKVDLPRVNALSAEGLRMSTETGLGRFVDFVGHVARIPSRFLGAEDEFFKTIGYRMELHAQALRQATGEGLKGDALAKRMGEILLSPPEHLRIAATDAALYSTFSQAPGAVGQAFLKMREQVPATTFVMPFVRTPVNIARYTFERSPFAPLVAQWRADIAAGGARADLALAKMSTGSAMMLTALDMADSGSISGSGPKNAGEREAMIRQGWQPYSIKVGERWYSYNRTDPFGSLFGFAADVAERIRRGEIQEDDADEWQEIMAMGITAVSQTAVNKTYLKGVADLVETISDPRRYSERYVSNLIASFTPATALMGSIERAVDPTVRESAGPWQTIQAKLAGVSDKLPPRRNLWGEEVRAESGLGKAYDFFSPVASRGVKPSAIDTEIMRLAPGAAGDNVEGAAPARIGKRTSFDGVQVNLKEWPQVYDAYVKLAGNELKHPGFGMGAKDFLNALVEGKHPMSVTYGIRSDEMKLTMINQVVSNYRKAAQQAIMNDPKFKDFAEHVRAIKADKAEARLPVTQ